jgi:hypothetical protein
MNDIEERLAQLLGSRASTVDDRIVLRPDAKRRIRRRRAGRYAVVALLSVIIAAGIVLPLKALAPLADRNKEVQPAGAPDGTQTSLGSLPVAQPGQFYYQDAEIFLGSSRPEPDGPWRTRKWLAPDGSGRLIADEPANGADRYGIAGSTGGHTDVAYGPGESPTDLVSLTADPGGIGQALTARASASPAVPIASPGPGQDDSDMRLLRTFESLLSPGGEHLLDPASQAAVFERLIQIPGIETSEDTSDPTGRAATAVVFTDPDGTKISWFFTPDTHQVLAVEQTGPDGQLWERRITLESGIADSREDPPTASQVLIALSTQVVGG